MAMRLGQNGVARKGAGNGLVEERNRLEMRVRGLAAELAETKRALQAEIQDRRRTEKQLREKSFHDALTGLPNRGLFFDRLSHANARAKRHKGAQFAVLFLDLDGFKGVNDRLGHLAGDELLIALARRLEECVREVDTVARLGGDEFAILLERLGGTGDAVRVAKRVLRRIAEPLPLDGREVTVGASIGIAVSPAGEQSPEKLLRDADMAMYRAKLLGAGRYEISNAAGRSAGLRMGDGPSPGPKTEQEIPDCT
jgi:diguanylate cyclase (GGDEF)-like protein